MGSYPTDGLSSIWIPPFPEYCWEPWGIVLQEKVLKTVEKIKGRNSVFCIHPLLSADNYSSVFLLLFFTPRWPQPFLPSLPRSHKSDWDNRETMWALSSPLSLSAVSLLFSPSLWQGGSSFSPLRAHSWGHDTVKWPNTSCSGVPVLDLPVSGSLSLLAPRYPPWMILPPGFLHGPVLPHHWNAAVQH